MPTPNDPSFPKSARSAPAGPPDNGPGPATAPPTPQASSTRKGSSAKPSKTESSKSGQEESAATESPWKEAFVQWFHESQGWLSSLVVHMVALLALAMWILPQLPGSADSELELSPSQGDLAELSPDPLPELDQAPEIEVETPTDVLSPVDETLVQDIDLSAAEDLTSMSASMEISDFGTSFSPESASELAGASIGNALSGRSRGARRTMVRKRGGNKASEEAVEKALVWIASHQLPNGAWSFDHRFGPCNNRCRNPGVMGTSVNGATALALLPFLGAGYTHLDGEYKETVHRGIYFLTNSMKVNKNGGDLRDVGGGPTGRMYSHGIASIVLCEAYAMTGDSALARPAQRALAFIQNAQDPIGGGWRYVPGEPGDTSVVGWQLMALKSGHMAYLKVNPRTVQGAYHFLDTVQDNGGASYGYLTPGNGAATSAIGLLCRMYLGWKREHPALQAGAERFADRGPDEKNMYFNYYATQVMFHMTEGEGTLWEEWNKKLRDYLVASQDRQGHETGSWFFNEGHHDRDGGRLYDTAMATMILEVYYRHLPIFGQQATEDEFPE